MADAPPRRRPSDDPQELQAQLLHALDLLEQAPSEGIPDEPQLYRAYLQHAMTLAWRGVATGQLDAPRRCLDALLAAQPFVDDHLPDLDSPAIAAAVETQAALRTLYTAEAALQQVKVEVRLKDRRSASERAVLRVLFDEFSGKREYLKRGTIHQKLQEAMTDPPTPARVSQILAELYEEGILVCLKGPTQGNPNASFYALSPRGLELCRTLELENEEDTSQEQARPASLIYHQALDLLLDPNCPWEYRSIAAGLVGNFSVAAPAESMAGLLHRRLHRSSQDPTTVMLLRTVAATWEYRRELSSLAAAALMVPQEADLFAELIRAVERTLQPRNVLAFRVRDQRVRESLAPHSKAQPNAELQRIVEQAHKDRKSLFARVSEAEDLHGWALFNGRSVDLALEVTGANVEERKIIESIEAAYFTGRSRQVA